MAYMPHVAQTIATTCDKQWWRWWRQCCNLVEIQVSVSSEFVRRFLVHFPDGFCFGLCFIGPVVEGFRTVSGCFSGDVDPEGKLERQERSMLRGMGLLILRGSKFEPPSGFSLRERRRTCAVQLSRGFSSAVTIGFSCFPKTG